ncbi:MAG: hypothetical protein WC150_07545 [Bacteroidia bacterium]
MASNQPMDELEKKPSSLKTIITAIVILMLLGSNVYLFKQLEEKNHQIDEANKVTTIVKTEKDSVIGELNIVEAELEQLRLELMGKDSLLDVKDKEIQQKIYQIRRMAVSGDATQLKKAKEEIEALKGEMAKFSMESEELRKQNQELLAKNGELNSSLDEANAKRSQAEREKDMLTGKVKLGSQMLAANIKVEAVAVKRNKEKVVTRAKSVQKFRICFSIMQNLIVDKGPRNVYIRVVGPDRSVMSSNVSNTFVYNDKPTVYSEKKNYNYDNKAINMCLYWDKTQDALSKGEYAVELYDDLSMLGRGTVTLD